MIRSWVLGNESHENRNGVLLFLYYCVLAKITKPIMKGVTIYVMCIYSLHECSMGYEKLNGYHVMSPPWGFRQDGILEISKDEYAELIRDPKINYILESKVAVKQIVIEE